jgi:hypothetical protein
MVGLVYNQSDFEASLTVPNGAAATRSTVTPSRTWRAG